MANCDRCGKSGVSLSWGFGGICTECESIEKEREEDIEREEMREDARNERMEKLLERISDGGSSSNYSSYSASDTSSAPSANKTSASSGNLIVGAIAYTGVVWGAWVLMDHVVKFSLVWWLCALALIAGIPLYIAAAFVAFWFAIAAGVIAFVIYVVIPLVKYFAQNPY